MRLFLCGDVMTGRGIDQILPSPSRPNLYEPAMVDAREYIELAERVSGPIPRAVDAGYVWGEACATWDRLEPDVGIANLETSVTTSEDAARKGINYRMHPANVPCLRAARFDVCVLANNHVLDWGRAGLCETLDVLHAAGFATAGAGRDRDEAEAPAIARSPNGRVLVLGLASETSGVPPEWAARPHAPGVAYLPDRSTRTVERFAARVAALKAHGDRVVASIHWGDNWGYSIDAEDVAFAHALVRDAGVDVVHGHSSHHSKAIEVYRGRLILYGCGDFLNDYEGIVGHEDYRGDLSLMYFAELAPDGSLLELRMVPFRIERFRLARASESDARWLANRLTAVGRSFRTQVALDAGKLILRCEDEDRLSS